MLAVSDEEGFVSLFNTRRRLPSYYSCELDTGWLHTLLNWAVSSVLESVLDGLLASFDCRRC